MPSEADWMPWLQGPGRVAGADQESLRMDRKEKLLESMELDWAQGGGAMQNPRQGGREQGGREGGLLGSDLLIFHTVYAQGPTV